VGTVVIEGHHRKPDAIWDFACFQRVIPHRRRANGSNCVRARAGAAEFAVMPRRLEALPGLRQAFANESGQRIGPPNRERRRLPVYRGYDQAGLDAQYNLRARWPEHAAFMAAWRREGTAVRLGPEWFLDQAYGATPAERLDLMVPPLPLDESADNRRAPILLFIHGGFWQALDKLDVDWLAPAFAARGVAFAGLNYALAPMVAMDEIVRQARAAVAWLWRNAPAYGCDPARISVAGHSAGGHLAAMLAATDWTRQGGLPAGVVRGAFCISGVYDLEPLRLCYHQAALRLDPRAVVRQSPIQRKPAPGVEVVVTVGGDETDEFLRQQADFVAAWRGHGADVRVVKAPRLHHFDILGACADFAHPVGKTLLRLAAGA
jgi:arylformamidase